MPITIDLPKKLEEQLEAAWGGNLSQAVKEALAVEGYRTDKLSLGQVAALLDLSIDGANGFLKARGVPAKYTVDDLNQDVAATLSWIQANRITPTTGTPDSTALLREDRAR
jgi:predicted HTH domain antitoxin